MGNIEKNVMAVFLKTVVITIAVIITVVVFGKIIKKAADSENSVRTISFVMNTVFYFLMRTYSQIEKLENVPYSCNKKNFTRQ